MQSGPGDFLSFNLVNNNNNNNCLKSNIQCIEIRVHVKYLQLRHCSVLHMKLVSPSLVGYHRVLLCFLVVIGFLCVVVLLLVYCSLVGKFQQIGLLLFSHVLKCRLV